MRVATGGATLRCDYCKSVVAANADASGICFLDETFNALPCPVCNLPLSNAIVAGVALCACRQCNGLFVSMGLFESLLDALRAAVTEPQIPAPPDPGDLKRRLNCPRCRKPLDMHFYLGGGGSVIGGCENCSSNWLDGGVLLRIARAPHAAESEYNY
jgi:Zn-finger nucleic acid-binding protein